MPRPPNRVQSEYMDEARVREIRFLRATQGASTRALADRFGVGMECIRRILRWETWRWVGEEGPGATAAQWKAAQPAPTPAEVAAGAARLRALFPPEQEVPLEEILKTEAQRGAAQDEAVLSKLKVPTTRGDHLLGELAGKVPGDTVESGDE